MESKKKYILITGASSGIGKQIATSLSEGFNVILNGRNPQRLIEAKTQCSKNHQPLIWEFDLNNIQDIEISLSSFIVENDIEIISFVHCAGSMKIIPLKMVKHEDIDRTFTINVYSAALIIKLLSGRKINKTALRSVVLISSNISNFGAKAFSIYGASKAALDGLMRNLAIELAPVVRVNSVLPGAIQTEMTKSIFENEEVLNRIIATYPLGVGNKKDIYDVVEFLLSEKARWITGQQFTVDGGRTINITG